MRVLVACEFSGVVREAFRKRGHDAYSCDILPAEDDSNKHYQHDLLDGILDHHWYPVEWDLVIAHPPCTYLSHAGNVWINQPGRKEKREAAMEFFMAIANDECERSPSRILRGIQVERGGSQTRLFIRTNSATQCAKPHACGLRIFHR